MPTDEICFTRATDAMKRFGIILVLLMLAALCAWREYQTQNREVSFGEKLARQIRKEEDSLRHGAVLVDFVPPAGDAKIQFDKKVLWRKGEGLLREKDHRDAVVLKTADAEVFRYVDDLPMVHQWLAAIEVRPLRHALMAAGLLDESANELIRDALATWRNQSDADLLTAFLVADEGALVRAEDPRRAVQLAIALKALDITGPVGVIKRENRTIYVFQEQETADFHTIAECRWVAIGDGGKEECHGVIRVPRARQDQTMRVMWAAAGALDAE